MKRERQTYRGSKGEERIKSGRGGINKVGTQRPEDVSDW